MLGLVGGVIALYPVLWRRRCLTWGATAEEAARTLPGDDLLPDADIVSTRAVTIHTSPDRVWPWLVQMGSGRGGAYTYDWIENLFGLNMHSADTILPEFQHVHVGDAFPVGEGGPRLRVEVLHPDHAFVVHSEDGRWVWAFILDRVADSTRLISRNRIATPDASVLTRVLTTLVMEPGSLIMERKMLLGIRQRAEHTSDDRH